MDISPVNEAPLYPNAKKMEEQNKRIPAYGQRQGWVPRTPEDFGDGGAFPEIHIAQYPLNMGKKNADGSSVGSEIVSVNLSKEGKVEWDAIIKRGRSDQIIYSKHSDMMEKQFDEDTLGRPDSEMEKEATDKTRAALEKKLQTKIRATQPANADNVEREGTTKYIRYTPANQNPAHNSGADTRIIRMVEVSYIVYKIISMSISTLHNIYPRLFKAFSRKLPSLSNLRDNLIFNINMKVIYTPLLCSTVSPNQRKVLMFSFLSDAERSFRATKVQKQKSAPWSPRCTSPHHALAI
jgi:hypothetical protein